MILDACCSYRVMWYNKNHSETVFIDWRREVKPDIVCDFKHLPFREHIFELIVFDPPHTDCSKKSIFYKKFGTIKRRQTASILFKASKEFNRVLKHDGFLIFKWNTHHMQLRQLIPCFSDFMPLFGQKTAYKTKHSSSTYWTLFKPSPS